MMAAKKKTKKSVAKISAKTRSQIQSHAVKTSRSASSHSAGSGQAGQASSIEAKFKSLKVRKSYVILVIVMFVLGAFLYYARGIFVAAVVNGQPISRVAIIKETEKQAGKQALDTIIRNTLIEQEARKQKVTVTSKEIDDEIKKIDATLSKQGQKLDQVLIMQNMKIEDLRKLIRLDKLVGKIVGRDIKVTDKEINDYLEKNKEVLPQGQSDEQLRKIAMDKIKQDKLNEKVQAWLESLKNKAKILYFVQY